MDDKGDKDETFERLHGECISLSDDEDDDEIELIDDRLLFGSDKSRTSFDWLVVVLFKWWWWCDDEDDDDGGGSIGGGGG
jgi:hypothetical protein